MCPPEHPPARLQSVPLSSVDLADERFRIRSFREKERLSGSLELCGILQPPLLWAAHAGECIIVDGFERLHWAKVRGVRDVPARVFPAGTEEEHLWRIRIQTLLFGPSLNAVQKADALRGLAAVFSPERIHEEFFPLLEIPLRTGSLAAWLLLAGQDPDFLHAVASGDISERVALDLVFWEPAETRRAMADLLRELHCSASIQWEIVERIAEAALKEEVPRREVLQRLAGELAPDGPSPNHRRRTQLLRDHLSRMRFPRLNERESRFRNLLEKAGLPQKLDLLHPPFFEGSQWQLRITFASPGELKELLEACSGLALSPSIHDLMSPKLRDGRNADRN